MSRKIVCKYANESGRQSVVVEAFSRRCNFQSLSLSLSLSGNAIACLAMGSTIVAHKLRSGISARYLFSSPKACMRCLMRLVFVSASVSRRCRPWIHCGCRQERRDKRSKLRKNRGSGLKIFAAAMPNDDGERKRGAHRR